MADDKEKAAEQPKADEKADEKPSKKAKESTVTLTFQGQPYTGRLSIGHEHFDVKDGKVEVPERLAETAGQAGFR